MNTNKQYDYRINNDIKGYSSVRIIGDGIESKVVTIDKAKQIADTMGVDMILVNSNPKSPIVRLESFDKFLYNLKKADKKKKQNQTQVKEIRLTAFISEHDLETKVNKAKEFIADGDKVRVSLILKGREMARKEDNQKSILTFIVKMDDVAIPEGQIQNENNRYSVILKKRK